MRCFCAEFLRCLPLVALRSTEEYSSCAVTVSWLCHIQNLIGRSKEIPFASPRIFSNSKVTEQYETFSYYRLTYNIATEFYKNNELVRLVFCSLHLTRNHQLTQSLVLNQHPKHQTHCEDSIINTNHLYPDHNKPPPSCQPHPTYTPL